MAHTGILKYFQVLVHYRDGSRYTTDFSKQTDALTFLESVNLTDTYSTTISPVWSRPGEVVELEVYQQGSYESDLYASKAFPPAGDL